MTSRRATSSRRGIVTIRGQNGDSVASVARTGKLKPKAMPAFPSWYSIKRITWIQGKTLERIQVQTGPTVKLAAPKFGQVVSAIVKQPTPHMISIGCDRCAGPHESTNAVCSANLELPTPLTDPNTLYDFYTGEPLRNQWNVDTVSGRPK